jgi:hypothetical protein
MLGFVSRFGSSKGMVAVPNLLGVATATANSRVTSAGLRISQLSGTRNTNVISEGGVSLSQTPAAGTLVDYETEVVITSGNYIADTVTVSPNCENYGTTVNDPDYCSGTLYVYGSARTKRRKTITTTNNVTGTTTITYDNTCTDDVVSRGSAYLNGQCGYVAPPTTCTAVTNYGAYGACSAPFTYNVSGTKTRTVSGTSANCQPFSNSESATCCQEVCLAWSAWDTLPSDTNKERRGRMCQRTDCSKDQEQQVRCKTTTSISYGVCRSGRRSVTTTVKDLCTGKSTSTSTTAPCTAV